MLVLAMDDEILLLDALTAAIGRVRPQAEVLAFTRSTAALQELAERQLHPDVAFLDIEMPGMGGLELARRLKEQSPRVNIVFVTGFSQYALEAMKLYASGYILKPVSDEELACEFENLRHPPQPRPASSRIRVQCFGNFEVYVDDRPVEFPRSRAKEVFAYLVSKRGTACTLPEIAAVLFEDEPYSQQLRDRTRKLIQTMIQAFSACGAGELFNKTYNNIAVRDEMLDCDYYRFLKMDTAAVNAYAGEFMAQYEWAIFVTGYLDRRVGE
ncbi:MAG: response regulator [Oscillospiraceae bacterium]|nr:response regulator [Oscillospiraceae bacterium]